MTRISFPPRALAAAVVVALALPVAVAAEPFGYTQAVGQLYRLDLDTGETEAIGPTSVVAGPPLALHADGTLYGLGAVDHDSLQLVTFDLATGAGSVVGGFDLDYEHFIPLGLAGDGDGGLWGSGVYRGPENDPALEWHPVIFDIDPGTGSAGEPIEVDVDVPFLASLYGLAACGNRLLAASAWGLMAIDPASGATSTLFPPGLLPLNDMDIGPDGALWTLTTLPTPGIPSGVSRMDLTTGAITGHGQSHNLFGLAVTRPGARPCGAASPVAIPTLSPLALVVLAVSLAVAALWVRRLTSARAAALAVAIATFSCLGPTAGADPIAYTVGVGEFREPQLERFDLATFVREPIGSTGGSLTWAIAFHADGTLYGLASDFGEPLQLVTFDLVTGAEQVVAELGLGPSEFYPTGFTGDSDGGLWMTGYAPSGALIFPSDPVAGTVGEPVLVSGSSSGLALASCGDRLIGSRGEGLEAIDPITGETSVLFQDAPWANNGMDVAPDGGLWAAQVVPVMGPFQTHVSRLDLVTGEVTPIGWTRLGGLAIGPPAGGPCIADALLTIPTLSPLALVVLAISLAVAARWVRRRHA